MEEMRELVKKAHYALSTADHMAFTTYPLLKEPKLIPLIVAHLDAAVTAGMNVMLQYDEMFKRIPALPKEDALRYKVFKEETARRYNVSRDHLLMIDEIKDIVKKRKEAPMEFKRKEKYVIALANYKLKMLTIEKVKQYVQECRLFMKKVDEVSRLSDRRFV